MRELTVKYKGQCKRCNKDLEIGQPAMYEKSMGIFCIGCEPKDIEEIRAFRLEKAEQKAEKYEEWASKRECKVNTQLNSHSEIRHDWAFITQPGHIPMRAQMIKSDDRAYESLQVAEAFREKAHNLRKVRVAGDAERKYQAQREANDLLIQKGSKITDIVFGEGTVISIHKKSYRIQWDKSGRTWSRDKIFVKAI